MKQSLVEKHVQGLWKYSQEDVAPQERVVRWTEMLKILIEMWGGTVIHAKADFFRDEISDIETLCQVAQMHLHDARESTYRVLH